MGSYNPGFGNHLKTVTLKSQQRQFSKKVIIKVKPEKTIPKIPLDTMQDMMVRNSTTNVKPWMTDRTESPVID